jgi:hypothetical protein
MLAKRNSDNTFSNCWDLDEATHVWVTGTGFVEITTEIRDELLKKYHLSMSISNDWGLPRHADGQRL